MRQGLELRKPMAEHPGSDRQRDSSDNRERPEFGYQQSQPCPLEIHPMRNFDRVPQGINECDVLKDFRHAADRRGESR